MLDASPGAETYLDHRGRPRLSPIRLPFGFSRRAAHGASRSSLADQQFRRDIIQITRWEGFLLSPASAALNGSDEIQLIFCPRNPDVKETAFLFHGFGFV